MKLYDIAYEPVEIVRRAVWPIPVLIAVVVILVLSASMSTLSSLVLTSSSTLTLDFIKGLFKYTLVISEP